MLHSLLKLRPSQLVVWFPLFVVVGALANSTHKKVPFIIAPMVEALGYCSSGSSRANLAETITACEQHMNYGANQLKEALDAIEPGGANGKVQLGYTIGVNLLDMPKSEPGREPMARLTQALKTIKRPAVIYLMANHFAFSPNTQAFKSTSYAKFADQSVPNERYFQGGILPTTLDMNPELDVNRLRFSALKQIGKWYKGLPESSRQRIHAITLAGELHHYFPDFAHGMGKFDGIRVTDYSDSAVKAFQTSLQERYGSIESLNKTLASSYTSFAAVTPPARDIRKDKLDHIGQHFDGYAHGLLPIEGWMSALPPGHSIKVYLDGQPLGTAEYGLNRQDVYEAVPAIANAQVGFRYWLDFSALERGVHTVQVMVEGAKTFELAKRTIVVMGSSQATPPNLARDIKASAPPKDFKFYLDQPQNLQSYFFNPLARDWNTFRSAQVKLAYQTWFNRAVASGLPKDKLFSHQIAPATVGGWNPMLFAADTSLQGPQPYKKGINLYGGSASVSLLKLHYVQEGEEFGVPEFHSQAWKDPDAAYRVLQDFQMGGASFVSPYFISMVPEKFRGTGNAHNKFRIAPENPDYGSDFLYKAIVKLTSQ